MRPQEPSETVEQECIEIVGFDGSAEKWECEFDSSRDLILEQARSFDMLANAISELAVTIGNQPWRALALGAGRLHDGDALGQRDVLLVGQHLVDVGEYFVLDAADGLLLQAVGVYARHQVVLTPAGLVAGRQRQGRGQRRRHPQQRREMFGHGFAAVHASRVENKAVNILEPRASQCGIGFPRTPPCPRRAGAFERGQARQDVPMLPRVLHLKEVALLLYREVIARGESSWVRRPPGVRIRVIRSLVSLLSLFRSHHPPHPRPFLSLVRSSLSG